MPVRKGKFPCPTNPFNRSSYPAPVSIKVYVLLKPPDHSESGLVLWHGGHTCCLYTHRQPDFITKTKDMNKRSRNRARTESFDLIVNGQALEVNATPYLINGAETRFRVSYNDSPVYIFAQNPQTHQIVPIEDNDPMPAPVVRAIADKLKRMEFKRAA